MCVCNAQSVRKKIDIINDYKQEHDLDMYLIVESWLLESEEKKIGDLEENGYKLLLTPRMNRIGGGIRVGSPNFDQNLPFSVSL